MLYEAHNLDGRSHLLPVPPHMLLVGFSAAGFQATCEDAVWVVRRGGRVVQVGLPLAHAPQIPMARVANREIEIVGSHGLAAQDMPEVLALVAAGKLNVRALIEAEVSLEDGCRALESMDHSSPLGITVITSFREEEEGVGHTEGACEECERPGGSKRPKVA